MKTGKKRVDNGDGVLGPIGRRYDFDFRYSPSIFFVRHDEIGANCEFTNIRVVASKKKGLRVNREHRGLGRGTGENVRYISQERT